MAFTYDGFLKEAQNSGLLGQFSQADLETAQKHPEFGYSILSLKKDYGKALTDEARLLINQTANQLRSSYANYSGGADGSGFISGGKIPGQIDATLEKIGSFAIPEDPTAAARKKQLDAILNRGEFSWNKEEDPLWPVYKKQYLREGERATANALGQTAAATGGRPSSFAVGAATQAGDYYAAKLNDIIPTLYQEAYSKYIKDHDMSLQDLQAINEQQGIWRQGWKDELGVLESQLSTLQGQDAVDYGRYLEELARTDRMEERDYQRGETVRQTAVDQVAAILKAGGVPSNELLTQAGLTGEYAQGVNAGWNRDNAVEQVAAILQAGGLPSQELLAAAGLTDEYAQGVHGKFQREEADEQRELMRAQVDAILQAGGTPSQAMIDAAGYSNEYVSALVNAFKRQEQEKAAAKRVNDTQSPVSGSMDYDGLFEAAKASGRPKSFLAQADNYKRYGFNSSSGLWDDYQAWEEEMEEDELPGGGPQETTRKFTSYDSAIHYLRQQGIDPGTPYTSSEWSTRRSAYKRSGKGDDVLMAYDTYADYITAYVRYCLETKAK